MSDSGKDAFRSSFAESVNAALRQQRMARDRRKVAVARPTQVLAAEPTMDDQRAGDQPEDFWGPHGAAVCREFLTLMDANGIRAQTSVKVFNRRLLGLVALRGRLFVRVGAFPIGYYDKNESRPAYLCSDGLIRAAVGEARTITRPPRDSFGKPVKPDIGEWVNDSPMVPNPILNPDVDYRGQNLMIHTSPPRFKDESLEVALLKLAVRLLA